MPIRKKSLYTILGLSCLLGYVWVYLNYTQAGILKGLSTFCLFKHATHIPCPSCGSTRSVLSVMDGNFINSMSLNPIGVILALILLISPLWLMIDILLKRSTLHAFYLKLEMVLRKKWVAIFTITLVSVNWIWTICKQL